MPSLSVVSGEHRAAVIKAASEFRRAMFDVQDSLRKGSLGLGAAFNDSRPESAVNYLYVVKLLESLPGVGKVRARRVMNEIGISPKQRVSALSAPQRFALLKEFGA